MPEKTRSADLTLASYSFVQVSRTTLMLGPLDFHPPIAPFKSLLLGIFDVRVKAFP